MNKNELRNLYKDIRHNITDKEEQNSIIYNTIINDKQILASNKLLLYASLKDEVDTINIIKYFIDKKVIALPKVENDIMNFYIINSLDDLKAGTFNILEPTTNKLLTNFDNSVMLVPGIVFDRYSNRIGYGKGYYDKFLQDKNIYTIGLSYKECIIDKIDINENDIQLKRVITTSYK